MSNVFVPGNNAAIVRYQVADLGRSLSFYTDRLGFRPVQRGGAIPANMSDDAGVVRNPTRAQRPSSSVTSMASSARPRRSSEVNQRNATTRRARPTSRPMFGIANQICAGPHGGDRRKNTSHATWTARGTTNDATALIRRRRAQGDRGVTLISVKAKLIGCAHD